MKTILKVAIMNLVFYITALTTVAYSAETLKADSLLKTLKHSTRDQIASQIYHYAKKSIDINDIESLFRLLDNKEILLSNDDFTSPIQVRDIALICIEEITGEFFLLRQHKEQTYPSKGIITYISKDGTPYRFTISSFSDKQIEEFKYDVGVWISSYKKGTNVKK